VASGVTFQETQGVADQTKVTVATVTDALAQRAVSPPEYVTAIIDWGDGSQSQTNALTSDGTTYIALSMGTNHYYATVGTFSVTVTFTSFTSGATAVAHSTAVVGPQFVASGVTFQETQGVVDQTKVTVATVTDALPQQAVSPPEMVTAIIDWGDGSQSQTNALTGDGTNYVVLSMGTSHAYAAVGTFDVTVTFTSVTTGATAVAHSTAQVIAAP
jgi:hypothetical protein